MTTYIINTIERVWASYIVEADSTGEAEKKLKQDEYTGHSQGDAEIEIVAVIAVQENV